ncbi:hypothetical protein RHMOL_Rhmol01G0147600 [Rhododendron molle]|uniref:Uncharacterized protein n=1 Tax=Rhododendron molle TaxID=49168 RepID=A0ACC0Q2X8_RHOML|nr:hypothetical protein RHMOL_Rhmol01G0147600 [Rhododendron molle]
MVFIDKEQNLRWTHIAADLALPRAYCSLVYGTLAGLSALSRDGARGPQYPCELVQLRKAHLAKSLACPRDYRRTLAGLTTLATTLAGLFYPHEFVQLHGAPIAPRQHMGSILCFEAPNLSVAQLLAACQYHDLFTHHHASGWSNLF